MRRPHEEGHALFTTSARAGALLATQGLAGDAPPREAAGEGLGVRHTSVCRRHWSGSTTQNWNSRKNTKVSMGQFDYQQFSERHRPHIHPPGATIFVTYRLAGSIPKATVREYKAKKEWLDDQLLRAQAASLSNNSPEVNAWVARVEEFKVHWFMKFEDILHKANVGPMWMRDEEVAARVSESLRGLDGKAYRLDAYSIMSNHVHAIFQPFLSEINLRETKDQSGRPVFVSPFPSLPRIMQTLKGRSARECNLVLSRTGQFWEHEGFDHVIRTGKFDKTVRYVLNNPVKVGLAKRWTDWRWNYCREDLRERF